MNIVDGIAYAGAPITEIRITEIKHLNDMTMIVTFDTGEKRLFNATQLLKYPAFASLADDTVFKSAQIEWDVITWCDGELDIAPEFVYANSLPIHETAGLAERYPHGVQVVRGSPNYNIL